MVTVIRSAHFRLKAFLKRTPTFSICTDDGTGCVERCKRLSLLGTTSVLLLSLPRRVSTPGCSGFANTEHRTYMLDVISTAYALSFKLYENPASMNLYCHIFSSSSILKIIMHLTETYLIRQQISHFWHLISGSLNGMNSKRCRKCTRLEGTET